MKILKRMKSYALKHVDRFTKVINQLPDRKQKIRLSPLHQEKKHVIKGVNPVSERIIIPNKRRDRKPKGAAHSETKIFNHPRG